MADIEHSQIPSEYCHEPKGAAEAASGEVYVADGAGSGSFKKLPVSSIDTVTQNITDITITEITDTDMVEAPALTQVADGTLEEVTPVAGIDINMFKTINKNTAELYRLYNNQVMINQDVKMYVEDLQHKVNEIIAALKNWGIAE